MRHWLTLVIAATAPRVVHASGAVEELSAGAGLAPGSSWVSDKLAGIWDLDAPWQLRLDLSATRAFSGASKSTREDIHLGSLSAVYAPDDHWSLRLTGSWSPTSTMRVVTQVQAHDAMDDNTQVDARLHTAVTSLAVGAGVDYDSAADSAHSLSISLSVGATEFTTLQETISVQDPSGSSVAMLDTASAWMRCQIVTCSSFLLSALSPQEVVLGQFALGASITDTIERDTDISLDASYYLYDQDPLQLGYLPLATIASGTRGSATSAPLLRDAIVPSVAHRWGDIAATVSLSLSDYADGEADVNASMRVQYKLVLEGTRRLKLYAKLAANAHADAGPELTRSGSLALGAQYTW
jgi:hypothetical protein